VRGFVQSFKTLLLSQLLSQKIRQIFAIAIPMILTIALLCSVLPEPVAIAAPSDLPPIVKAPPTKAPEKPTPKPTPKPAPKPAPKPEISLGERTFTANCAACHIGGNNIILAEKSLSKDALEKYAMNSVAAIKTQVTSGKNAMPAFGDNLTSAEIEAVARYVITQSQIDWKGSSVGLQ
jgi:cytochrome c6